MSPLYPQVEIPEAVQDVRQNILSLEWISGATKRGWCYLNHFL
jgi:hypothetical protein